MSVSSSTGAVKLRQIVLARVWRSFTAPRERPYMSKRSCEAAESTEGAILRMGAVELRTGNRSCEIATNRACTSLAEFYSSEGAPVHEQKELRSSGEHRRCDFANGRG